MKRLIIQQKSFSRELDELIASGKLLKSDYEDFERKRLNNMSKMFDLLKEGLEEALEYHRGNVKLRTKEVVVPDMPKSYKAADIKKLRGKLKFSQSALATWLFDIFR